MKPEPRFVTYLRVSTDRQGRSGLGIEAQRAAVEAYLAGVGGRAIAEVVEVESGRRSDRPELARALSLCRSRGATLLIAKLDRLARNTKFLLTVVEGSGEAGVVFCDLPSVPAGPVGKFLLTQMAAVAELEAGLISTRTKAALAAAKARGVTLGGARGYVGTPASCAVARAALAGKADDHARGLAGDLAEIDPDGTLPLRAVAEALQARGALTPTGRGRWTAIAVARLRRRLEAREARRE